METITVQRVTRQSKTFNNEKIWGVMIGQSVDGQDLWVDLHVAPKPAIGQQFNVNMTEVPGKDGRIFIHARPVNVAPALAPRPPQVLNRVAPAAASNGNPPVNPVVTNGHRTTPYTQSFDTYQAVALKAHALALELEPGADQGRARMAFVHTCLMALGEGKITLTVEDDWDAEIDHTFLMAPGKPTPAQRVKQEKHAAHEDLARVLNDVAALKKTIPMGLLVELQGVDDVLYLTEKEAIKARLALEKILDDDPMYRKSTLHGAIKSYCTNNAIDFDKEKTDILLAVSGTRSFKALDQTGAKKAVEALKTKYGHAG